DSTLAGARSRVEGGCAAHAHAVALQLIPPAVGCPQQERRNLVARIISWEAGYDGGLLGRPSQCMPGLDRVSYSSGSRRDAGSTALCSLLKPAGRSTTRWDVRFSVP